MSLYIGIYNSLIVPFLPLFLCGQEGLDPGLVGQPMLEDLPPAEVPLRIPGHPTRVFQIPLGPWAAIAPMALFYPSLSPSKAPAAAKQEPVAAAVAVGGGQRRSETAAAAAAEASPDVDVEMFDAGEAKGTIEGLAAGGGGGQAVAAAATGEETAGEVAAAAEGGGGAAGEVAAAGLGGDMGQSAVGAAAGEAATEAAGLPCPWSADPLPPAQGFSTRPWRKLGVQVEDVSAVEGLYLAAQARQRVEGGEVPPAPVGVYSLEAAEVKREKLPLDEVGREGEEGGDFKRGAGKGGEDRRGTDKLYISGF